VRSQVPGAVVASPADAATLKGGGLDLIVSELLPKGAILPAAWRAAKLAPAAVWMSVFCHLIQAFLRPCKR